MNFTITAVPVSPSTRRRTGKSFLTVVNTTEAAAYADTKDPRVVERVFETLHNVKVIDVRPTNPAEEDPAYQEYLKNPALDPRD